MNFWERYCDACNRKGVKTQTQQNADAYGVTRASITSWKLKNIVPNGTVVAKIADHLGTTSDYLLGRTPDPSPQTIIGTTAVPKIITYYFSLDSADKLRVEAYMEGLLTADKYASLRE